jgi:hypothetical protein
MGRWQVDDRWVTDRWLVGDRWMIGGWQTHDRWVTDRWQVGDRWMIIRKKNSYNSKMTKKCSGPSKIFFKASWDNLRILHWTSLPRWFVLYPSLYSHHFTRFFVRFLEDDWPSVQRDLNSPMCHRVRLLKWSSTFSSFSSRSKIEVHFKLLFFKEYRYIFL